MQIEARKWLKGERILKGMTGREVAATCNISQPYYSLIEQGKRNVPVPTAKKIGAALGFDWKRFYE